MSQVSTFNRALRFRDKLPQLLPWKEAMNYMVCALRIWPISRIPTAEDGRIDANSMTNRQSLSAVGISATVAWSKRAEWVVQDQNLFMKALEKPRYGFRSSRTRGPTELWKGKSLIRELNDFRPIRNRKLMETLRAQLAQPSHLTSHQTFSDFCPGLLNRLEMATELDLRPSGRQVCPR